MSKKGEEKKRVSGPENNDLQSRGMGSARLYREGATARDALALLFFLPPISPQASTDQT